MKAKLWSSLFASTSPRSRARRRMLIPCTFALLTAASIPEAAASGPFCDTASCDASNPDWMASLPDYLKASEVSLPGTHDTMTYSYGGFVIDDWVRTQNMNLETQLTSGIRVVDIRCRHADAGFSSYHGSISLGATFDDVLTKVKAFLTDHPRETIYMRIKEESSQTGNDALSFEQRFAAYRQSYAGLIWTPDSDDPPLKSTRGKVVILQNFATTDADHARGYGAYGLDYDAGDRYIDKEDDYQVSGDDKWSEIEAHFSATGAGSRATKYVTYLSASKPPFDYPQYIARDMNPRAVSFLADHQSRTGMVMMDFPGSPLINQIIDLNPGRALPLHMPNLALGRPTSQSSTASGAVSDRAVDGFLAGDADHATRTNDEAQPWWQVDLGSAQPVDKVVIYNRTDGDSGLLSNFGVMLSTDGVSWSSFAHPGLVAHQVAIETHAQGAAVTARYVRIKKNTAGALGFAEVEVVPPVGQRCPEGGCSPIAWSVGSFRDRDTLRDSAFDWDPYHSKMDCAAGEAVAGISVTPEGDGNEALCRAMNDPFQNTCSSADSTTRIVPVQDRGPIHLDVDWDQDHWKLECDEDEFVAGVSEDAWQVDGDNELHGIRCAKGKWDDAQQIDCSPRLIADSSDLDPLASGDWDWGNRKGECASGEFAAGLSVDPATRAPHAILCCRLTAPIDPDARPEFDRDGKSDLELWRPSNGMFYISTSSSRYTDVTSYQYGTAGDVPVGGVDVDGDRRLDLMVWRPSTDTFYVKTSSSGYVTSTHYTFGLPTDMPLGGSDFDGDGRTDLVLWRASNDTFYIKTSSSGYNAMLSYAFGLSTDTPLGGADLDGDGKTDLVAWRPSNGTFYVKRSSSSYATTTSYPLGVAGDLPISGCDFDGDGKTDLVVWRASNDTFYVRKSSFGYIAVTTYAFGLSTDVPIGGADVDGDGKTDLVVWRPSAGNWYIKTSSSGYANVLEYHWGTPGDQTLGYGY